MSNTDRAAFLKQKFASEFGGQPHLVARAPGRVELIGGHTDYNDGYVLPAAIDLDVLVAASPNSSRTVNALSIDFEQKSSFALDDIRKSGEAPWSNYVRGVLLELLALQVPVVGMDLAITGNIPRGSGLSSSAAIEVAVAVAALRLAGAELSVSETAKACKAAENNFVGVNSGIMDQFISLAGRAGSAMFLDCRSLRYSHAPLPRDTCIIVCDSTRSRTLASSGYNDREAECQSAVKILRAEMPGIKALRDVSIDDLSIYEHLLPEAERKRAHHVVCENERVLESFVALESGDAKRFGELLNHSHASARDLYQISIPEIDILQEAAANVPGCLGSRLMGGGFGGGTVNLVKAGAVEEFTSKVKQAYLEQTGLQAAVIVLEASEGAQILQ